MTEPLLDARRRYLRIAENAAHDGEHGVATYWRRHAEQIDQYLNGLTDTDKHSINTSTTVIGP